MVVLLLHDGPKTGLLTGDSDGLVLDWPSFALADGLAWHGMKQLNELVAGDNVVSSQPTLH